MHQKVSTAPSILEPDTHNINKETHRDAALILVDEPEDDNGRKLAKKIPLDGNESDIEIISIDEEEYK